MFSICQKRVEEYLPHKGTVKQTKYTYILRATYERSVNVSFIIITVVRAFKNSSGTKTYKINVSMVHVK